MSETQNIEYKSVWKDEFGVLVANQSKKYWIRK
jgi:hypothetical protein